ANLFSYLLQFGLSMEPVHATPFKEALFCSRNAEEALLVVLNACSRVTRQLSPIMNVDPTAFGAWLKRIQGQRTGPESVLAISCLGYLDLSDMFLDIADFYGAELVGAKLENAKAHFSVFDQ